MSNFTLASCTDFLESISSDLVLGREPQMLLYTSILLEMIWKSRNSVCFERKKLDIFHLHRDVLLQFKEFKEAFSRISVLTNSRWIPLSNRMAENQQ
ncbi:hypothetical protein TorRG33x02_341900 [Trema orientale]|uniref:Uncharacterized protein n=1 Tax=Trema orientale TaxID=63057 RepID=A0A2P5AT64_TREOI|nr:hypothetical protein TorRG33x02_341900 [Trema orientale]